MDRESKKVAPKKRATFVVSVRGTEREIQRERERERETDRQTDKRERERI